jgi:predicted metal-dependent phosphoesterase TrpH
MKCDLHIHSKHSFDSLAEPKKIVDLAIKRGLQCIAIADHGNNYGAKEAASYVQKNKLPIFIIVSEEVKSKSGDILALNIEEPIPDHLSVIETLKRIKAQKGTSIIAHPFGLWCNFKDDLQKYRGNFDGVEALNASVFKGNEQAQKFAQDNNLPLTAGSDAHLTNHFIGKVWLDLPIEYSDKINAEQIIELIKKTMGQLGGKAAPFLEKAIDHPLRTITKLKGLTEW